MYLFLEEKRGLYNTYHELLSEKWIFKRYRFHASYIISPQSVPIFATSHLVGCIEYLRNSLEDKVDKSSVTETISVSLMGALNSVYLFFWQSFIWHYYILPLTIISFILSVFFNLDLLSCWVICISVCSLKFYFTLIKLLKRR